MIRSFVGLAVDDALSATLEGAQTGLTFGTIVQPENFHLTLAFLGEHSDAVLEEVHHELARIRGDALDLSVQSLGVFGGASPRVLFAEVIPNPGLTDLRRKVRSAVRTAGIELDHKRFHPHITLARFGKGLLPAEAAQLDVLIAKRIRGVKGRLKTAHFVLYESRLSRNGPVYDVLAEYPLGA